MTGGAGWWGRVGRLAWMCLPGRSWPGCWRLRLGSCGRGGSPAGHRGGPELDQVAARPGGGGLCGRPDRVRAGQGAIVSWGAVGGGGPSKLERPAGDRVKTDRRDAERLAWLLHIGELPGVGVPTVAEEAARDLVRAREDARADLMRARHRLSKLLVRQGWSWTARPGPSAGRWLVKVAAGLTRPGLGVAVDEAHGAVLAIQARRDRLDGASVSWRRPHLGAGGRPAGLAGWGRSADQLRAGGGNW
jgi:hypothetical protein